MKGGNENGRERESEEVRMMMIVLSPELFDYCLMLDVKPWIVFTFQCARLFSRTKQPD